MAGDQPFKFVTGEEFCAGWQDEMVVITKRRPAKNLLELRQIFMPYGRWTCADGREVLFNREYTPIWQRRPGQSAKPAKPGEWVEHVGSEMIYSDSDKEDVKRAKGAAVLAAWGLPVPLTVEQNAQAKK